MNGIFNLEIYPFDVEFEYDGKLSAFHHTSIEKLMLLAEVKLGIDI